MKAHISRFLGRIRGERATPWPWSRPRVAASRECVPFDETGWTVHRDIALRLKNLSFEEPGATRGGPAMDVGSFKIRLSAPPEARRDASTLVERRYASRGYQTSATMVSDHVCTFGAYDEGRLAGTVSLRLDSDEGLAADSLYRAEVDALRAKGYKICEFTRLAVDASRVSKPVLAGLFHTVFLFAERLRGYNFVVIEVNPRHVGYYRRSLGFDVIGPERHSLRVGAPAVLMGVSFRKIGDNLRSHGGKGSRDSSARSFYVYGFSLAEEAVILDRLRKIDAR
jgi:hypothetical protein